MGSGHTLGERGGEQGHTLSISELPTHVHTAVAAAVDGTLPSPATNYLGQSLKNPYHAADNNLGALFAGSLASVGGSQAHLNMQPFLVLNFSIALQGIFPSQT
jgi:microcystin-dependent protein